MVGLTNAGGGGSVFTQWKKYTITLTNSNTATFNVSLRGKAFIFFIGDQNTQPRYSTGPDIEMFGVGNLTYTFINPGSWADYMPLTLVNLDTAQFTFGKAFSDYKFSLWVSE